MPDGATPDDVVSDGDVAADEATVVSDGGVTAEDATYR